MSHTRPTDPNSPRSEDPFLLTESRSWSFGDLYALAPVWKKHVTSLLNKSSAIARSGETLRPGTFLLLRSLDPEALLLHIACAWISRIPILPLDPAMPASELESMSASLPWDGALVDEPGALPSIGLIHESPAVSSIEEIHDWQPPEPCPDPLPDSDRLFQAPGAWWGGLLTSGSSGPRKIVPHRRQSWIHAIQSGQTRTPMAPGESWLLPLPLYHAGGMNVALRALLTGSAVLLARKSDPASLGSSLKRHPDLRAASMVPTQLGRLLTEPDLSVPASFHGILLGGGPIRESLLRRSNEIGLPVIASYGMTETVGQVASQYLPARPESEPYSNATEQAAPDPGQKTSASGNQTAESLPIPGPHPPSTPVLSLHPPHEARVLAEGGATSEPMAVGVLQIRGPQLFEGYMEGRKIHRTRFDSEGWFTTGDWVRLHPADEGLQPRLEILSRRTDLILSGGENVQPGRVEMVMESLTDIREALVVGLEDAEWGERVVALVIPNPAGTRIAESGDFGDGSEPAIATTPAVREWIETIRTRIADKLTPAERPKEILPVQSLPTTGPGKRDRRKAAIWARHLIDQIG